MIIAGHIASDTLGMNLLFDALQRQGRIVFGGGAIVRLEGQYSF